MPRCLCFENTVERKILDRILFLIIYLIFGCAGPSLLLGLFSSCSEQELLSSCTVQASPVAASLVKHWFQVTWASAVAAHELSSCGFPLNTFYLVASLVAQPVKNPPAMQEMWVQSLDGKDPLEKEMTTHSSIPAWEISWTEEPGGLQSMGLQNSWTRLSIYTTNNSFLFTA